MLKRITLPLFYVLLVCAGISFGADIILNEYNAVDSDMYLNGGDASGDLDGGFASDSYFGRVEGNGGDWFELVVITDHLDLRGWKFDIYYDGSYRETLNLTNHALWSDLRSGTIITIAEDVVDDVSYNPIYDPLDPDAGDHWINVQANATSGTGTYIEKQSFPVNNNDWQLVIKHATNAVKFGPCGEGVLPAGPGIGNTEVFRLEADPSASITADSVYYDDGKRLSTFGAPNRWGSDNVQDFSELRSVIPEPATILLFGLGGAALLQRQRHKISTADK